MKLTCYIFLLALICCSCGYRAKQQNEYLLNKVEKAVNNASDSATTILDSIHIETLNEMQYQRYIVLKVRARSLAGINISADTIVFNSKDYFLERKVFKYAARACYTSAQVYEARGEDAKAIQNYQDAAHWAKQSDNELCAHAYYGLGRLYYIQQYYTESIVSLKQAYGYYQLADSKYEYKLYTLELTAMDYFYINLQDSASVYFDHAMKLATEHQNILYQKRVFHNISIVFCKAKKFDIAKEKCFKALSLTNQNDNLSMGQLYSTLASIYNGLGQVDSAFVYAYRSKDLIQSLNLEDKAYLFEVLSSVEQKKGRAEMSLRYKEMQMMQLSELNNLKKIKLAAQSEDKTLMELQKARDILEGQKKNLVIVTIVMGLFILAIITGALMFVYKKKHKTTKKILEDEINHNRKLEQELKSDISNLSESKMAAYSEVKSTMHFYRDILELYKIAKRKNEPLIMVRANKLIAPISWESVCPIINILHDGIYEKIKAIPVAPVKLTEFEIRIACLAYADLDNDDIAVILRKETSTIANNKTELNKKLGLRGHFSKDKLDKKYFQAILS